MANSNFSIGLLFVLLAASLGYAAPKMYGLDISYVAGRLSLDEAHLTAGFSNVKSTGDYQCRLVSGAGEVLDTFWFDIHSRICHDAYDTAQNRLVGGSCEDLNDTHFTLFIPYNQMANWIEFYDSKNHLLLSVDVSEYSGNATTKIPPVHTSITSTSATEISITTANNLEPETGKQEKREDSLPLLVLLLATSLIAIVYLYKKIKEKEIEKQREDFIKWKEAQERIKSAGKPPV